MELREFRDRSNLAAQYGYLWIKGDIGYLVTDLGQRRSIRRSDFVLDGLTSIMEIFLSRCNLSLYDLKWICCLVLCGVVWRHVVI